MTKPKNHPELTAERLRELLHYNPETGEFRWRVRASGRVKVGAVAGSLAGEDYWRIKIGGRKCFLHRLVWLYVHGVWPADQLDHINGVRSDNRLVNLREATSAENSQNHCLRNDNKSRYPGVHWHNRDKKWRAMVGINGRSICVGYFDDPETASIARNDAKAKLHTFQPVDRWALGGS